MHRALALLSTTAALAACSSPAPARPPAAAAPPRLVVLLVIDQLPAWAFAPRAAAADDGLGRLIHGGRRHTARYPYVATQTAPGHAALGTGAPPSVTGILGNEWWRRELQREMKAAWDPAGPPSAQALRVEALGDALVAARPDARAVAVAIKDRSAIMPLGRAGTPVWYEDDGPCFIGRDATPPPWLAALAETHPIAPRLTGAWKPSDPSRLAELSGASDDAPGELGIPGWDATFPHAYGDTPNPAAAITDAPLGNEIVVEAAIAAVRGEALGADDVPDLLVVSFSAHDYTGHAFGLDSWEAWDAWLQLDRQIGDLTRALDAEVGAGQWAAILTSDHGAPPLAEVRAARGEPSARFTYGDIEARAEAAAATVAGAGDWIGTARYPTLFLTAAGEALPAATRARVIDAIVADLATMPGLAAAGRTADVVAPPGGDCAARTGTDHALCLSLDAERSGEIWYLPAPGSIIYKAEWVDAVTHGSAEAYDREVPLVVYAPGVAAGDVADVVSPLQVAPTLARWLGVPAPAAATEPPLSL